ncbi:MAG: hypothetical protein KDA67_02060 [Rhodobacteraceae bacterium]|nr:hypothetical protein [Paracoccaceae bacterium]
MKRLLVMLFLMLATLPAAAGGLAPVIPKASGKPHPEGNLFMRINHMKLMKHDRDQTVREGDREIGHSLKACIECHAVNGADGQPVDISSDKHFCRTCHDFAAVKVDCFQCHNSRPEAKSQVLILPRPGDTNDLAAYLEGAAR